MTIAKGTVRRCLYFNECHKEEIHNGLKWKELWCKYKEVWICNKHYNKLIGCPKRPKGYNKKYNRNKTPEERKKLNIRKIRFFNKSVFLSRKARKGICEWCGKKEGDKFIKTNKKIGIVTTDTHHYFYLTIMKWACTVEICKSCHSSHHNKEKNSGVRF